MALIYFIIIKKNNSQELWKKKSFCSISLQSREYEVTTLLLQLFGFLSTKCLLEKNSLESMCKEVNVVILHALGRNNSWRFKKNKLMAFL